jgi:hypothetical protein
MFLPGLSSFMTGLSDVVSGFATAAAPTRVSKTFSSTDGGVHSGTTPVTTASPVGGIGPFTYAWTRIAGDAAITATSAATAATAFSANISPDVIVEATFRCTATDTATGATATTDVDVTLHHVDLR